MVTSGLAACVILSLTAGSAMPVVSGRPNSVKPLYTLDRKTMPRIEAVEYPVKDGVQDIFAVPERSSRRT